jgi:hypothetical protein
MKYVIGGLALTIACFSTASAQPLLSDVISRFFYSEDEEARRSGNNEWRPVAKRFDQQFAGQLFSDSGELTSVVAGFFGPWVRVDFGNYNVECYISESRKKYLAGRIGRQVWIKGQIKNAEVGLGGEVGSDFGSEMWGITYLPTFGVQLRDCTVSVM